MPAVQTPTLRDVADAAGVHPATASRALNPATRGLVNADTARRVMKVAESLGYRPNPIARGLKTAKSGTVGLVIPDLTNPLFPPIVRGIEDVLEPAGYSGLIVNTDNDPQREHAQIELLRSRQVEGLIVATALLDHPLIAKLHARACRWCWSTVDPTGSTSPRSPPTTPPASRWPSSTSPTSGTAGSSTSSGPPTTSTGVARRRAFRNAVRDRDLDDDPALVVTCEHWTEEAGATALRHAARRTPRLHRRRRRQRPDRARLLRRLRRARHRLPARDERGRLQRHAVPRQAAPPLTTLAIPHQQIGAEAARMLLDAIAEPDRAARSVLLPLSLVVRGSTAPPAT